MYRIESAPQHDRSAEPKQREDVVSSCAGNEPFVLQVLGDSMEPEFPHGCMVIVEPGGQVKNGCFVIARTGNEVILRRVLIKDRRWQLEALNSDYPILEIEGPESIQGLVIQRAGKRRSDRKSYLP